MRNVRQPALQPLFRPGNGHASRTYKSLWGPCMSRRVLTSIVLLAWSAAPAFAQDRVVLPADVVPEHYDIAVVPHAAQLTFDGHVAIDVTVAKPTSTIKLNAADLAFGKVSLTGEAAAPK